MKAFEAEGIDRDVAEAHARAMSRHIVPQLATTADVQGVHDAIKTLGERFEQLHEQLSKHLESRIDTRATELKLWGILTMLGVATAALTVARLLTGGHGA
jgi:hypothetical protein